MEDFSRLLEPGSRIAVEATGTWWWFVDLAEEMGHQVVMSHPKATKAIAHARLKNDKVDAAMLAYQLRANLLPTVWIPPAPLRQAKELLRHRFLLMRFRTALLPPSGRRVSVEVRSGAYSRKQPGLAAAARPDDPVSFDRELEQKVKQDRSVGGPVDDRTGGRWADGLRLHDFCGGN